MMVTPKPTAQQKEYERQQNEKLIKEFLERGGKIEVISSNRQFEPSRPVNDNQSLVG